MAFSAQFSKTARLSATSAFPFGSRESHPAPHANRFMGPDPNAASFMTRSIKVMPSQIHRSAVGR
jgi:hypothetical protein